tara:strand:+ start:1117 stop:4632 length:3516 start_codon:yes stop_codon:yes gene_type:complete
MSDIINELYRDYEDNEEYNNLFSSESETLYSLDTLFKLNRYALLQKTGDLSVNLNTLNNLVNNLDLSFDYLNEIVRNISGVDSVINIVDLSNAFNNFKSSFDSLIDLCNNYITFNTDISLSSSIYNFNNSSLVDLNLLDNSNNLILNYSQINQLLQNYLNKDVFQELSGVVYQDLSSKIHTNISDISDLSFVVYQNVDDLSKIKQDLCNNFIFSDSISGNLQILKDISLSGIITTSSDLSYEAITQLDNSSGVILNLKQINQLIDSKDFSSDGGGGQTVVSASGTLEYVNDVSQTFYQIMTQQPYAFNGSGVPNNITTSIITLSWNYNNIIANHNMGGYNAKLAFLDNNKQQQLPHINNLIFEISGNVDGSSTGWINLTSINIPDNVSYDQESYKVYELLKYTGSIGSEDYSKNSIISSLDSFDLRIYGSNFSEEIPSIDERSLYFYNIAFPPAQPPSQPNFIDEIINSNSQFTLTYDVSFTENDVSNSDAVLNGYIIDYSQNETKASLVYPVVNTDLSDNGSLNNILRQQQFNVIANGLRSGTSYNYALNVKNNLNDFSYSEYSDKRISDYTLLPDSNGINTNLNLNIGSTYTNVSTQSSQGLNNSNVLYINLSSSQSINPSISSNQTIEISNPMTGSSQQNDIYGYGKYIDNSLNLVSLSVSLNSELLQTITFDGSFSSTSGNNVKLNSNISTRNFDYISLASGTSLLDIWNGHVNNEGFRLKGLLKLNSITNNQVPTSIGDVSTNAYVLNYNYVRHDDVGGSNQNVSYNIYVDDLSLNPLITGTNSSNVVNVLYNFGIPSIKQFDLSFNRTYSNINSTQGFIPGNEIIADVKSIANTSATSTKNIYLLNSEISNIGTYNFNDSQFDSKTSNAFNNLNYSSSRLIANNNLSWSEEAYSLFTPNGITKTFNETTNHYLDYASFTKSGTIINNNNINLTNIHVYELSNISLLGTNLGGLELIHYNNHTNQIQEYSLLHINNKFQSNVSQIYPVINDFSYNGVTITNDFSAGLISYDLNGLKTGNNSGYKYITLKLYKSGTNAYLFNGSSYPLEINADNVKYLNLKTILTQSYMFNSSDIANIFNENSNDAIGFARVTRTDDSVILIGNLKQLFNPTGGNWNVNGSPSSISYNNSLQLKYGAKVLDGSNYGLYLSPNDISDDLTIFIGIKNT